MDRDRLYATNLCCIVGGGRVDMTGKGGGAAAAAFTPFPFLYGATTGARFGVDCVFTRFDVWSGIGELDRDAC